MQVKSFTKACHTVSLPGALAWVGRNLKKLPAHLVLGIISVYKLAVSPFLGNCCRYHPSCSSYARTCFSSHPFFVACYLTTKRLLSCHPWGGHGYDPVPPGLKDHR